MTSENPPLRVPYALSVYDDAEIQAVLDILKNHKTIMGEKTKEFESQIEALFGKKHGIMVNSGSSANLVAIELLQLPKGAEVITPALTFATTLSPIIQKELTPVFVDVEMGTYLADLQQVKSMVTPDTKCLMIPSLIGNVPDLHFLQKLAEENNLWFIEDSCDTLGATFNGKPTGTYSHISTTSFYGAHVITAAGGGGMICVNTDEWDTKSRMLRGWGRSSAKDETEDITIRFGQQLEGIEYDSKFIFEEVGYNFLPLEISSTFGLEQLKKFPDFMQRRKDNFSELKNFFTPYKELFTLPQQSEKVDTNWISFPLVIRDDAPFTRLDIVTRLEENNIQTRPIFTGNILRQPAFKNIRRKTFREEFPNTDHVMKNGFVIGCNQGLTSTHMNYMKQVFSGFLDRF